MADDAGMQTVIAEGNRVDKPLPEHGEQMEYCALPTALLGGTRAMQAKGKQYLPQEPDELPDEYTSRVTRSVLFNGFGLAVGNLTGKVFKKPVQTKDVPTELEYLEEDADGLGNHLNVFARMVFHDAMAMGLTHVLVDMPPKVVRADGSAASVQEERDANQSPYFVHVPHKQVIGWRHELRGKDQVLTQLRILTCEERNDGRYGVRKVEQIRVLEPGRFEIWEKDGASRWYMAREGMFSLNEVPLVTFYTERKGTFCAKPPLEDLAFINLQHWQSSSDQRTILHVARVPLLFGKGFDDSAITVGPNRMIKNRDPQSDLKYVEHTGAAIEAGAKDLEQLEDKMRVLGLDPLMPGSANPTATGRIIDSVDSTSKLQDLAFGLGDVLESCYMLAAKWLGIDEEKAGEILVNDDIGFTSQQAADLQTLLQSRLNGEISRETFWSELKRRGVLADSFDAEEEAQLLADEGPEMPPPMPPGAPPAVDPKTGLPKPPQEAAP